MSILRDRVSAEPAVAVARQRPWKLRYLLWMVGGAVLVVALTYALPPFRTYQFATVGAYLCVTAGLTVLTGLNGQLSLGHGALMATGAYTVALLQERGDEHWPRSH